MNPRRDTSPSVVKSKIKNKKSFVYLEYFHLTLQVWDPGAATGMSVLVERKCPFYLVFLLPKCP